MGLLERDIALCQSRARHRRGQPARSRWQQHVAGPQCDAYDHNQAVRGAGGTVSSSSGGPLRPFSHNCTLMRMHMVHRLPCCQRVASLRVRFSHTGRRSCPEQTSGARPGPASCSRHGWVVISWRQPPCVKPRRCPDHGAAPRRLPPQTMIMLDRDPTRGAHLEDMALGATARPWNEAVGWKPWADATKSAPYSADRITILAILPVESLFCGGEADTFKLICFPRVRGLFFYFGWSRSLTPSSFILPAPRLFSWSGPAAGGAGGNRTEEARGGEERGGDDVGTPAAVSARIFVPRVRGGKAAGAAPRRGRGRRRAAQCRAPGRGRGTPAAARRRGAAGGGHNGRRGRGPVAAAVIVAPAAAATRHRAARRRLCVQPAAQHRRAPRVHRRAPYALPAAAGEPRSCTAHALRVHHAGRP